MKNQVAARMAVLAIVGLVSAQLVVLPALPAQAATGACPDSIGNAGFVDLGGLSAPVLESIDCLVHYGVSTGTTATTFSPEAPVPRWQMAVFLTRTARALGIGLPDGSSSQFTDINSLAPEVQLSIRQLAQSGITSGVGPSLFGPLQTVTRWQMAIFVDRLLARAGVPLPSGTSPTFTDLGGLSDEAVTSISRLVALGVAAGTGTATFSPNVSIPRWQMALLLARTLNVGQARPVRLSISFSASTVPTVGSTIATIRVTKPDGSPYPGLLIDVFASTGLAADGTCLLDADASLNGGDSGTSLDCRIDPGDSRTNSRGEVRVGLAHSAVAEVDTIWAWVGAEGQVFDADTVVTRISGTVSWIATADGLAMSPGMDAAFGTSAVVNAQLTGTQSAVVGQTVVFELRRDGLLLGTQTRSTGSGGLAQFTYIGPGDPSVGDDEAVVDEVRAFWDRNGNGVDDGEAEFDGTTIVTWDEP